MVAEGKGRYSRGMWKASGYGSALCQVACGRICGGLHFASISLEYRPEVFKHQWSTVDL